VVIVEYTIECVSGEVLTVTISPLMNEDGHKIVITGLDFPCETIGAWATPEGAQSYVLILLSDLKRNVRSVRDLELPVEEPVYADIQE